MAQEKIVREFLGKNWQRMPYDWIGFDPGDLKEEDVEHLDDLDDMGLLPIPSDVLQAYVATRNDPSDRSRDEPEYGKVRSREDNMRNYLKKRAEAGEPLIPFCGHLDQMTAHERKQYALYEADLRALAEREFGLKPI
jgi:hypothetical protein